MKFLKSFIIIFILFALFSLTSEAQHNDAGLWTNVNLEKKLNKQISVSLSEELRLNQNIAKIESFFTDVGVEYKINKILRVGAYYRFINKPQNEGWTSQRHRYYFDLSCRTKINMLTVSFRSRYQSQYKDFNVNPDGGVAENYWRNKLNLKYDLNKHVGFFGSYEIFTPLRTYDQVFKDNVRYNLGLEYSLNKIHSFDVSYLIQRESNVTDPETDYIICIGYNFNF